METKLASAGTTDESIFLKKILLQLYYAFISHIYHLSGDPLIKKYLPLKQSRKNY